MFKKFRQILAQTSAVVAFRESMREDDLVSARKHYSKFQNSEVPRDIAMGARLHLMERNFDEAKALLKRAFSIASQKKDKNNRYVCEYCRHYLSRIEGDENHMEHWLNAHSLKPSSILFDSLPLYRRDRLEDANMSEAKHRAKG